MRALAPVILTTLLLAGCIGGAKDAPEEVEAASAAASATAAATMANETANASAAAPPVPKTTPIAYSGKTLGGACAFLVVTGECQFADEGAEAHHAIAVTGTLVRLEGTLAYSATAPAGEFVAYLCGKVGDKFTCDKTRARGPSPLKLSWDLADLSSATELMLGAYDTVDSPGVGPVGVSAYVATEFKVDAALTTLS